MTALQVESRFGTFVPGDFNHLAVNDGSAYGRDVLTERLVDRGSGQVVYLSSFPPGSFGADPT